MRLHRETFALLYGRTSEGVISRHWISGCTKNTACDQGRSAKRAGQRVEKWVYSTEFRRDGAGESAEYRPYRLSEEDRQVTLRGTVRIVASSSIVIFQFIQDLWFYEKMRRICIGKPVAKIMQDADGMIHANSITIKNKEKNSGYGEFSPYYWECGCLFLCFPRFLAASPFIK